MKRQREAYLTLDGLVLWGLAFNNSWAKVDLSGCEFKYCTFHNAEFRFSKITNVKFLYCNFPSGFKFRATMSEGLEVMGCTDNDANFVSHVGTRREWERDSGFVHTTQYVDVPTSNILPANFFRVGESELCTY